jgi:hypothetical protein
VNDVTNNLGTQVALALNPRHHPPGPYRDLPGCARCAADVNIQWKGDHCRDRAGMFVLFGDRLLFVAHGVVLAGVDLAAGPDGGRTACWRCAAEAEISSPRGITRNLTWQPGYRSAARSDVNLSCRPPGSGLKFAKRPEDGILPQASQGRTSCTACCATWVFRM